MTDIGRLAYVDLETTGSRARRDRITEVGIVLTDDHHIIHEWQALLNPGIAIPLHIQQLTGITPEMLSEAPGFHEVAEQINELLKDRIFVAHNARFDYSFIRQEFQRLGQTFNRPVVCTVKLSRHLYPRQRRHNLDSLLARHDVQCSQRHRALDDARVLPHIVNAMISAHGQAAVDAAIQQQLNNGRLPSHINKADVAQLPHGPGVYFFYGENDNLLYVGKSINLHDRVYSHFSNAQRDERSARIADQLRRIEWIETSGELGALLLEAELIKTHQPLFNRRLRRNKSLLSIHWNNSRQHKPEIIDARSLPMDDLNNLYGLFRNRRQATQRLRSIADKHSLCHKLTGLETGKGACFAHQLGKCHGACVGKESEIQHRIRMQQGLSAIRLETWPYPQAVMVKETHPASGREKIHVIEQWRHLGSASSQNEVRDITGAGSLPPLDIDHYKILVSYFRKNPGSIQPL